MLPRLIVAMPRGAAQVSLTVPAMCGLLAPLAAFSLAINMAFTVARGMRLSREGIAGHTQNLQTCAGTRTGSCCRRVRQFQTRQTAQPRHPLT